MGGLEERKEGREGRKKGARTTRFCLFTRAHAALRTATLFRHVLLCCGSVGVRQCVCVCLCQVRLDDLNLFKKKLVKSCTTTNYTRSVGYGFKF